MQHQMTVSFSFLIDGTWNAEVCYNCKIRNFGLERIIRWF